MDGFKFTLFEPVEKTTGDYRFPGIVVSAFRTLRGLRRYVVECTVEGCDGILHIFSEDQLRSRKK